ncbi:conserved hypothetical protein [Ricinus communis]|uniref:Uncharacterized protein n=1 Tax=Ricinus communis TaxID=3988 RepID=B9T986_RICCO|nr:conserved hypothetical protein [Ricinus communis]
MIATASSTMAISMMLIARLPGQFFVTYIATVAVPLPHAAPAVDPSNVVDGPETVVPLTVTIGYAATTAGMASVQIVLGTG